jgi:hypothetical protein
LDVILHAASTAIRYNDISIGALRSAHLVDHDTRSGSTPSKNISVKSPAGSGSGGSGVQIPSGGSGVQVVMDEGSVLDISDVTTGMTSVENDGAGKQ